MNRDEPFAGAFRRVFESEFDSLFRYLNRLTGDSTSAGDIAQETFVRLYRRGAMPRDTRAWLAAVANNLVRDEYRTSSRRRVLLEANLHLPDSCEARSSLEDELLRRERERRVRRALDGLPVRYRQALLLRSEGYSYREIASALDYRVSGVGKLIVRAMEEFRRAYEEADASA